MESMNFDKAVSEREAAQFLGCSEVTLRVQRSVGKRPGGMDLVPFFKMGRLVRYSMADLQAYRDKYRVCA